LSFDISCLSPNPGINRDEHHSMDIRDTYTVVLTGGYPLQLRMVDIARGVGISLLNCNDEPYEKIDAIIAELVDMVRPYHPDAVVGVPEQGIPLVHGVGRALGLRRSYLLRKTPKGFDVDPLVYDYTSVTRPDVVQRLYLPRDHARDLDGKRVAIIEDVANTGMSLKAVLELLRKAGTEWGIRTEVVGIFLAMTEGHAWQEALGEDARLVHALAHIPVFRPIAYEIIPGTE
jgi:adenine/guanine phosphoribosyltransferase-like PRPP-binding protein